MFSKATTLRFKMLNNAHCEKIYTSSGAQDKFDVMYGCAGPLNSIPEALGIFLC